MGLESLARVTDAPDHGLPAVAACRGCLMEAEPLRRPALLFRDMTAVGEVLSVGQRLSEHTSRLAPQKDVLDLRREH